MMSIGSGLSCLIYFVAFGIYVKQSRAVKGVDASKMVGHTVVHATIFVRIQLKRQLAMMKTIGFIVVCTFFLTFIPTIDDSICVEANNQTGFCLYIYTVVNVHLTMTMAPHGILMNGSTHPFLYLAEGRQSQTRLHVPLLLTQPDYLRVHLLQTASGNERRHRGGFQV
jgi:hypothetical protein